ncbi:hypothetical protein MHU86_19929 [Fragilaria crotonensis]|nr:hypothetical protein MHU86_19929 [Fragilaria crotonensis]
MVETFKFAHAEYLGPAADDDPAPRIRATEVPIAVLVTNSNTGSVTIPASSLGTRHSPSEAVPLVPATSLPATPIVTRYTRTYTITPPLDRMAMKKRRKRRKIIAGVVGGTIGLVALGPLGAVGIGIGSALVVKHADRAHERRVLKKYEARCAQDGTSLVREVTID